MNTEFTPQSIDELAECVRAAENILPVGARTKPALSQFDGSLIYLTRLTGIIEYEPSEFTFTALAGTPVREIVEALAERGQYLPFDPMLVDAGATLGGTVASGLNGAGRFRYGGLRDFILGVRFVDGWGRMLRMGGKVVKNAAGFDLPKFFVGSLGRFGVLAEVTFKVFPRPASLLTLKIPVRDASEGARVIVEASRSRWELDSLDLADGAIFMRLGGPPGANEALASEIRARWPGEVVIDAERWWKDRAEFRWAHSDGVLVRIPVTPVRLPRLLEALHSILDFRAHASAGGNVVFVSLPAAGIPALETQLQALSLSGLTLRGDAPLTLGVWPATNVAARIKGVLDPHRRFPSL